MSDNRVIITLKDIYDEIVHMRGEVNSMQEPIHMIPDHEKRIRSLERWRYALPTTVIVGAISIIVSTASTR